MQLIKAVPFTILRLVLLLAAFLSLIYICFMHMERDSATHSRVKNYQTIKPKRKMSSPSENQNKFTTIDETPSVITYNLMEESYGSNWSENTAHLSLSSSDCTIDYVNQNKLQQDHPCIINLIRKNFLREPAPKSVSYQLDDPLSDSIDYDPSDGQSQAILKILQNKRNGFFIECGGYDGEFLSNTLYMERSLNWSGLLIEANRNAFSQLVSRNRKAYSSPLCLSTEPYPMEVFYNGSVPTGSFIIKPTDELSVKGTTNNRKEVIYKVQCFPLYSILLAVGKTHIDYFGLDIEGSEYKVLRTIPWHKIYIKALTVEWNHVPEGEAALTQLMNNNNFITFGKISLPYSRDIVFVQDFLRLYRMVEENV